MIIELPALVNVEVIGDRTFGDFIGYMAKDIQTRIKPLTTGGSSIDCAIDHTDVSKKLRQLTSYLETGYKETFEQNLRENTPGRKAIQNVIETRFQKIVEEVEKLMRKFEIGESQECFMELYSKQSIKISSIRQYTKKIDYKTINTLLLNSLKFRRFLVVDGGFRSIPKCKIKFFCRGNLQGGCH